jgi:fumarylacetoacetase
MALDETHDPGLRSFVASANDPAGDFPIQNLPLGAFSDAPGRPVRLGLAIGDRVLDLARCRAAGLFADGLDEVGDACASNSLNALMALGPVAWHLLRLAASRWLREGSPDQARVEPQLVPASAVALHVAAAIGDYTDFYASIFHATNVGSMLRPDEPLLPNYKHVPIGYHGRASSVVASGSAVRRPSGQLKPESATTPVFGPSRRLDYELEVGIWIGTGNALGEPIPIGEAERHVFGLCLLNDWSARDIQQWEYQPLGPFLAKSFATTVSPWIVTLEALEPFRVAPRRRPEGDPAPLPYLTADDDSRAAIDVRLEVALATGTMRAAGHAPLVVSRSSLRHLYWTPAQLVTHHASNGCNLRTGDLLGTGTVSGPTRDSRGCLLELTWRGTEPITVGGEARRFLEDGDEVIFRGWCERDGAARIGFGECRGVVEGSLIGRQLGGSAMPAPG